MSNRRMLVSGIGVALAVWVAWAGLLEPPPGEAPPRTTPASTSARPDKGQTPPPRIPPGPAVRPPLRLPDDGPRAAQISAVIESMDRTGRPPTGVHQGGRRGGAQGVFDNAQGRLPARPPRHYTETDVWPRRPGGRGAERLVFGRDGEVYYTRDHYVTFLRVR